MEVVFLMTLVALVPVVLWLRESQRRAAAALDDTWWAAAQQLGGTFFPGFRTWLRRGDRSIEARVQGTKIVIDHYDTRDSEGNTTNWTRARAKARGPDGLRLDVYRTNVLSVIGGALGFQDVVIGDRSFDDAYVIKSNDPEAARVWLNKTVRKRIRQSERFRFRLDKGSVEVERAVLLRRQDELVTLARAVSAFADGRQGIVGAWKRVAAPLQGTVKRAKPWVKLTVELDGVPVTVTVIRRGKRHYTVAKGRVIGRRVAAFSLARTKHEIEASEGAPKGYRLETQAPQAVALALTPRVRELLADLEPTRVELDARSVTVTWRGICTSQEELKAGLELCTSLATGPPQAPYR